MTRDQKEPSPLVQIQAGHELARLVEIVRFAPGQPTGFLHSQFDAEQMLWRWALKWADDISATRNRPQEQPDQETRG